jgi:hypothetical protein
VITCAVTLNGTSLNPVFPIGRKRLLIRDAQRMLNGQLRVAHRASKYTFALSSDDAPEAERAAWVSAASLSASVAFVDELGVSRTVVVTDFSDDLVRSEPTNNAVVGGTGLGFYDLRMTLEEV